MESPTKQIPVHNVSKFVISRQLVILVIFGLANVLSAITFSLQAPFYPAEAEKKGVTASEYGFVFGFYQMVMLVASPIYGKYMNKLGPRTVFNLSLFTTGGSCFCFGFLDKIDNHVWFISLSFLLRITEAIGTSGFVVSSFTIIACEFSNSVATTFATLETFYGLGLIVGPSVGGALFEVGGFCLPFVATGGSLFALGILSSFFMPKIEQTFENENGKATEGYGIFSILKIPGVFIAGLTITMSSSALGLLNATLEPHLRQFKLSQFRMGLMFTINGGVYAIFAPVFGRIIDKISKPILFCLFGSIMTFSGFLLIGPAPFIPLDTILWVSGLGLFIHGVGQAANYVAVFVSALRYSLDNGFPDNVSTYSVVSGLWISCVCLGGFIGSSVGGVLLDHFGFRKSTWYNLLSLLFMVILLICFITFGPKVKKGKSTDIESTSNKDN